MALPEFGVIGGTAA